MTIQRFGNRVGATTHLDLGLGIGIKNKSPTIVTLQGLGRVPDTVAIGIDEVDAEKALVIGVGVPITWIEKAIGIRIDIGR